MLIVGIVRERSYEEDESGSGGTWKLKADLFRGPSQEEMSSGSQNGLYYLNLILFLLQKEAYPLRSILKPQRIFLEIFFSKIFFGNILNNGRKLTPVELK